MLAVFALWVGVRWLRLRTARARGDSDTSADGETERDPLERLKRRYADGELSDAEFEARVETLLDTDSRAEVANEESGQRRERSRESG